MTYKAHLKRKKNTPATQRPDGREDMQQSASGAFLFVNDEFSSLRRYLITGTKVPTFYEGKFKITKDFENHVVSCAQKNGARTADIILEVSDRGLSISNDSCIFACVLLSKFAPKEFYRIGKGVIRTMSHFHQFVDWVKEYRGTGGVISKFGKDWFASQDTKYLTYQFLKFNQRYGWTVRDQLRIFRPKAETEAKNRLYAYATNKVDKYGDINSLVKDFPDIHQLGWYEWLKANPSPENSMKAIREGGLTHEMVAPIGGMNDKVWNEIFQTMPMTATLRNLGNLTTHHVFDDKTNIITLHDRITNRNSLKRARIHPYSLLLAGKVYASGGHFPNSKSSKTWSVNTYVKGAVEKALGLSFDIQQPTNLTYMFATDLSASMTVKFGNNKLISCVEVAALMALVAAKTEPYNYTVGFESEIRDIGITAKDTLLTACQKAQSRAWGGTNVGKVYDYAMSRKLRIDTFVFFTDGESWGGTHAFQRLNVYRKAYNPRARAIYVTITPGFRGLADPQDVDSLTIGGFDPTAIKLMQEFSLGLV